MQNKKEMFVRVGVLTQIDPEKIEDLDVVMNAIIDGTISHESYAPAGFGFEEDDSNNGWISGEDIEFPFDHVALKDVVLNGLSTEALIAELQKRGVNVKPHGEKPHDTYLVTVDHVDGPSAQVCDTIGNAKAYVLGHTTNYDTFEEIDAALKGSIDAIDGVIEYSIVKQETNN